MPSFVQYETGEGVARIVLNRPEVLNCLNRVMLRQLRACFRTASSDENIRAVWLGAEGRAFSTGQDLTEIAREEDWRTPDLAEILRKRYNPLIRAIREIEKPVVCAVQGAAAGAGANLAFACDILVAAEGAYFVEPFSSLGLVPDSGGTFFLPRLAGLGRARAICLLGDKVSAEQALAWGLVYRVCPAAELGRESLAVAQKLAQMPAHGMSLIKRALNRSLENGLDAQLDLEAKLQGLAGQSAEFREAVEAFLAKRKAPAQDR